MAPSSWPAWSDSAGGCSSDLPQPRAQAVEGKQVDRLKITDVKTMTARQADQSLQDDELVLGVSIDGQSRAYPINMLSRHEIVNDEIKGVLR